MFYFICPTCGSNLARKEIPFENRIEMIENEIKKKKLSYSEKDDFFQKERAKVLDELFITNMCCRMRVLGHVRTELFIMNKTSIENPSS